MNKEQTRNLNEEFSGAPRHTGAGREGCLRGILRTIVSQRKVEKNRKSQGCLGQ